MSNTVGLGQYPDNHKILTIKAPDETDILHSMEKIDVRCFLWIANDAKSQNTTTGEIIKKMVKPEYYTTMILKLSDILVRIEGIDDQEQNNLSSTWLKNPAVAQLAILLSTVKDDIKHLSSDNSSTQPEYSLNTIHPVLGSVDPVKVMIAVALAGIIAVWGGAHLISKKNNPTTILTPKVEKITKPTQDDLTDTLTHQEMFYHFVNNPVLFGDGGVSDEEYLQAAEEVLNAGGELDSEEQAEYNRIKEQIEYIERKKVREEIDREGDYDRHGCGGN